MKYYLFLAAPALLAGLLSGCADAPKQTLAVTSNIPDATCQVSNKKGIWEVQTPGTVTVDRSVDWLKVNCRKGTYIGATKVEPRSGSETLNMATISYPDKIAVTMQQTTTAANIGEIEPAAGGTSGTSVEAPTESLMGGAGMGGGSTSSSE